MQYRSFPKFPSLQISTLGFGCMRLPTVGADPTAIDEEHATRLLHRAIDAGVNYVDTAWPYHGGKSEPFVGRALRGGWRERVQVATKSPVWLVKSDSDWERLLDRQLERLETGRIDFYLLHALSGERWQRVQELGGLKALERAKADGRIGHLGFSFHAAAEVFGQILEGYDWDFCQIQYNFLDEQYQAGRAGLELAASRKVGVVVMEPLRGGALAKAPPAVQQLWDSSDRRWSPSQWALRWLWNHPGIVTVLSGMNAESQLLENAAAASEASALTPADLAVVDEVRKVYQARMRVPCTTCGYCQPCPNGVAIPDVFSYYNAASMFDSKEGPAATYKQWTLGAGAGADRCLECTACEHQCPQGIAIIERLKEAHALLTSA